MRFIHTLYFRVLLGTALGILLGLIFPEQAVGMKVLGESFINLVKMIIGPVIFCTIVLGVSGTGDMKKVGRVGGKALLYFEVVSTFALAIGLGVAHLLKPGAGFNIDPATLDASSVKSYAEAAKHGSTLEIITHIIPKTFADSF
ncbi:MAG: cation:dicarboxylase symporter family transporter, partial [Proteobacteria bacterium]